VCVLQNIEEYDGRIVDQLLNFMHSYTSEVLQDAQVGKAIVCVIEHGDFYHKE